MKDINESIMDCAMGNGSYYIKCPIRLEADNADGYEDVLVRITVHRDDFFDKDSVSIEQLFCKTDNLVNTIDRDEWYSIIESCKGDIDDQNQALKLWAAKSIKEYRGDK